MVSFILCEAKNWEKYPRMEHCHRALFQPETITWCLLRYIQHQIDWCVFTQSPLNVSGDAAQPSGRYEDLWSRWSGTSLGRFIHIYILRLTQWSPFKKWILKLESRCPNATTCECKTWFLNWIETTLSVNNAKILQTGLLPATYRYTTFLFLLCINTYSYRYIYFLSLSRFQTCIVCTCIVRTCTRYVWNHINSLSERGRSKLTASHLWAWPLPSRNTYNTIALTCIQTPYMYRCID